MSPRQWRDEHPDVLERVKQYGPVGAGVGRELIPRDRVIRLGPRHLLGQRDRTAVVAVSELEMRPRQLDLAVGIQKGCTVQERAGLRALRARQVSCGGDDRGGRPQVVSLAGADHEPGADRDRGGEDCHPRDEHPDMMADPDARRGQLPVSVVIPNWNGRRWLAECLGSLAVQTLHPAEIIVVDNGSTDGSVAYLRAEHPDVEVIEFDRNTGFAHAANAGLRAARAPNVALINTDLVLEPDWLERVASALAADPGAASVACKMLDLTDRSRVYDAGDVLRRDGVCEQRGRFGRDDGRWDEPEEVFGACAGAALYRRDAVLEVGGFDERYFAYLEDVDLSLRLRLAGWRCRYEPAVALHAGESSSRDLPGGHLFLVERNTLVLVTKAFPLRWLPFVAYRQLAWAWHAARHKRLRWQLRGAVAAVPLLAHAVRERRALRRAARLSIGTVVPPRPIRGPRAGGHPAAY